jgi:hypothetical protein
MEDSGAGAVQFQALVQATEQTVGGHARLCEVNARLGATNRHVLEQARPDERPSTLYGLEKEAHLYLVAQLRARGAIDGAWRTATTDAHPHHGHAAHVEPMLQPRNPISELISSLDNKQSTQVDFIYLFKYVKKREDGT